MSNKKEKIHSREYNAVSRVALRDTLPAWLQSGATQPEASPALIADSPPPEAIAAIDSPEADAPAIESPEFTCTRCGKHAYRDSVIHDGRSVRRDCASCNRTAGFPVWDMPEHLK